MVTGAATMTRHWPDLVAQRDASVIERFGYRFDA